MTNSIFLAYFWFNVIEWKLIPVLSFYQNKNIVRLVGKK